MKRVGFTIDATQLHRQGEPTYTLPASCSNCGWTGCVKLTKGYRAPTGGIGSRGVQCRKCGCDTVTVRLGAAA